MRDLAVAMTNKWTLEEAVALAKRIEAICPAYGYHVALTGGLLYKEGPRKDCDLVLYQTGNYDKNYEYRKLLAKLEEFLQMDISKHDAYVYKAKTMSGKSVDIIFPEFSESDY